MKILLLCLTCVGSVSFLFSADSQQDFAKANACHFGEHLKPVFNERLKSIIAPHVQVLSNESIKSGMPIYAYKTDLGFPEGNLYQHSASYFNGNIVTYIGTAKAGSRGPEIGEQSVCFFLGESGREFARYSSKNWAIQTIGDVDYVVHYYDSFKVCTNNESQFVLTN